jgi:hypothetical protein
MERRGDGVLVSGPLRRRLDELERAVEGIKEAGGAGEERRAYWECFYSPEQVEARDRERRQGDWDLLERNRASVGLPPLTPGEVRRNELEGTAWVG